MNAPLRPRLRPDLEVLVAEAGDGERLIVLRDPLMLADDMARFGPGVLPLLQLLDGTRSLEDVRLELARDSAGFLDPSLLKRVVGILDRFYLLENERSLREHARRDAFATASVRPAAHAGEAYPAEPAEARRFFADMLALAGETPPAPLRRLVAPHIDLRLGDAVYARAHRRFAAAGRPDAVVVLGVRHAHGDRRFVACRKDFATPLGTVRHDARFLDALEARLGTDLSQGVEAHRREHSVEFQAAWLAHLWPGDPPALVPLLAGSFHDLVEAETSPSSASDVEDFVGALRETLAEDGRNVVVLASVDLAHVGPVYDHAEGLDEAGERALEEVDRALLDTVRKNDAEAFFEAVSLDGNARNVCGVAPLYVTLRAGDGPGDLLGYGQGRIHPESGSVVSFAALSFAS